MTMNPGTLGEELSQEVVTKRWLELAPYFDPVARKLKRSPAGAALAYWEVQEACLEAADAVCKKYDEEQGPLLAFYQHVATCRVIDRARKLPGKAVHISAFDFNALEDRRGAVGQDQA